MSQIKIRKLEDMREVLMDPKALGPEDVYVMIRGKPNITVLVPGRIGQEFTKTYGHYHRDDRSETYRVLLGEGKMLIQNRDASDVRLLEMKAGGTVVVPQGYAHTMINTGNEPLVTADDAPTDAETSVNDYEPIREKKGFGYYIVEDKGGGVEAVPNSNYSGLPLLEI